MLADKEWHDKILMVIPSVNGEKLLARMLPTLRFKTSNVIVLDQGSTDETAKVSAENGVELIQLGHPHTYTQACNIGARIALERGMKYLCVSNNDITFRTDVLAELFGEMERDPKLGIVAPSQVIIDESAGVKVLASRVSWNLDEVEFLHDTQPFDSAIARLESDFCELTCAIVRMSAVAEISFLDDDYGFYHEDADFGFRLRAAGYGCAYLPKSQIEHFSGSTFNREHAARKASYILKNKIRFAEKYLGYGTNAFSGVSAWDWLSDRIYPYIRRYGMADENAPDLVMGYPGAKTSGYLYIPLNIEKIPPRWGKYNNHYSGILASSRSVTTALRQQGLNNCFHVPLGVETDIFHPWGPTRRICDDMTYVAFVDGWQRQSLGVLLNAWREFLVPQKRARLILFGYHLEDCLGSAPDTIYRSGIFEIARFEAERIDTYEIISTPSAEDRACFYRAADYALLASRDERSTMSFLEAIACGVPYIVANDEFGCDLGRVAGSVDHLAACLKQSYPRSGSDRAMLVSRSLYKARNEFTLRHTAMALHEALVRMQVQNADPVVRQLRQNDNESAAIADSGSDRVTSRRTLSTAVAGSVQTLGVRLSKFGSVWQRKGITAAGKAVKTELGYFVTHKAAQISRIRNDVRRRATDQFVRRDTPVQGSVLLIGYIDGQLGLGQSLRGLAWAMTERGIPFAIYPFGVGVEGRRSDAYMAERYDQVKSHAINVIEAAVGELPTVLANISEYHFDRSYNILRTYWELSKAPEIWRPRLNTIHEIWAPNAFVAESLRSVFDRTITVVPPCISLLDRERADMELNGTELFCLDENRFYFMFSFDYFSFPQRKNPLAVLRAFRTAFPDPSTRAGLIVKTSGNPDGSPSIRDELRGATQDDPRIQIIDEWMTRREMLALMAATNCYVSMHRSEGFGLGMAEAMALGKPVIGTNYSGNTDFLSEETGYPVPFTLRKVSPDEYLHAEDQVWADPDEAACASIMAYIFRNPEAVKARAGAGQRFVRDRYGSVNVGRIVENRLSEIFALSPMKVGTAVA